MYPWPYCPNMLMYNLCNMYNLCQMYSWPYCINTPMYNTNFSKQFNNPHTNFTDEIKDNLEFDFSRSANNDMFIKLKDYGPKPYVVNIEKATKQNDTYRTALWTGDNLQVTLMSIGVGEDIGLELHSDVDQFIRIEEGQGLVKMGDKKNKLNFERKVYDDYAIMIPAGKWHNLINTGNKPLKLYSIYAPPEHPRGTVHETKAIAEAAEKKYHR